MKGKEKALRVGLPALLCLGLYAFQLMRATPVPLTLEEALAKKMISCTATSTGGHSGSSVAITVTNLSASPLTITIPDGTVFKPSEDEDQDLLITEPHVISLNGKAVNKRVLDGYCMEASDHSPTRNNTMKISKTSNKDLLALTRFLDKKGYDNGTIQSAVWAVSDKHPISYIDNEDVKTKELRSFLSTLTHQPDPWYEAEPKVVVREDRIIETNPVSVSGKIQFESDGQVTITEVVKNAAGTVVNTSDAIDFPKKGTWTYKFTLTVEGWEKGAYSVTVMNGTNALETFPFTI